MDEEFMPLDLRSQETVLTEMEREFSVQDVPTLQRLRVRVLADELFSALRALNADGAALRCAFPARRTMELQYRGTEGALEPDLSMVRRLDRNPCTDGVNAAFGAGRCTITIE